MRAKSEYNHFDIVYLTHDVEQLPYSISEFRIFPNQLIVLVLSGQDGSIVEVYEEQVSKEINQALKYKHE